MSEVFEFFELSPPRKGRIGEGWFQDGSWHDVLTYAILRIELNSLGG